MEVLKVNLLGKVSNRLKTKKTHILQIHIQEFHLHILSYQVP